MGEMASLWGYAEHHEMDQLGQKLLFTTLELEKLKSETMEEMRKNKEYVSQLVNLLKCAIQERDEAKIQLGNLITKTMSVENFSTFPHFQPAKANSSVTESNSLSDAYNYHSHVSSPVESLFDAVSSPDFSNNNFSPVIDQGSLIIDDLARGRVLPAKGMLLQAVIDAGPLLQTLLLAGPLPRWRNPPRLQPFQIPPVSIKGGDAEVLAQKPGAFFSGRGLNNGNSLVSGDNGCFRLAKRQRFC